MPETEPKPINRWAFLRVWGTTAGLLTAVVLIGNAVGALPNIRPIIPATLGYVDSEVARLVGDQDHIAAILAVKTQRSVDDLELRMLGDQTERLRFQIAAMEADLVSAQIDQLTEPLRIRAVGIIKLASEIEVAKDMLKWRREETERLTNEMRQRAAEAARGNWPR